MADCDGQFNRAFTDHEDVLVEILTRLPVKSLMRFRCVCKPWRSLIAQSYFATKHRSYADKGITEINNRLIFSTNPLASIGLENFKDGPVATRKLDFPVISPHYSVGKITLVGSCDGLICVEVNKGQFMLWNPSTRESKVLPKPTSDCYSWFYGFGYDSTVDDYKVIRTGPITTVENGFPNRMIDVLTLKTGSWKTCNGFNINADYLRGQGCLLNGALHWLLRATIMSFDLGEEKIREVPLPGDVSERWWDSFRGLLAFRNCLCVFSGSDFLGRFMICMMEEYGVEESWTQVIKLTPDIVPNFYDHMDHLRPLWILENGEFLADKVKEGHRLELYNPKEKEFMNVIDTRQNYNFESVIYKETLVSPAIGSGTGDM